MVSLRWRTELPQWVIIGGMFVLAAVNWPGAPDRVPVHWNSAGQVDGYGGKFEGLVLLPLVALGTYLLLLVLPRLDPGRDNYHRFAGAYTVIRFAILVVLAAIYGTMLLAILGWSMQMETIAPVLVGGLLVVVGSVLGDIQPNWFVGIRTPWTLSSRLSWAKTHRLGGRLFIGVGLVLMLAAFVGSPWALKSAFAVGGCAVLWLVVYSYLVWRSDPNKVAPGRSP